MLPTPPEDEAFQDQGAPERNDTLTTDTTQNNQSQDGASSETESEDGLNPARSEVDVVQLPPESIPLPDNDDELTWKPAGESREQGPEAINETPTDSQKSPVSNSPAAGGRGRSSSWPRLESQLQSEPHPTDREEVKAAIRALRLPGDANPDEEEKSEKSEEKDEGDDEDDDDGDDDEEEEEEEGEPEYNPFDPESESESDSDSSDQEPKSDTERENKDDGVKEGAKLKTSDEPKGDGESMEKKDTDVKVQPENVLAETSNPPNSDQDAVPPLVPAKKQTKDRSPAEAEWARQKKELGDKNKALDRLMAMIGLEDVKWEFLKIKATVAAARTRKGVLRRQDLNLVLLGNPGTGKRAIQKLYLDFLKECNVWPDVEDDEVKWYIYSGHEFVQTSDIPNLELRLQGDEAKAAAFLYVDTVEGMDRDYLTHMLSVIDECSKTGKIVTVLSGTAAGATKMLGGSPHGKWLFRRRVQLKDYDDEELRLILLGLIHRNSLTIEGGEDGPYPKIVTRRIGRNRGAPGFGNAHDVIMVFQQMLDRHAVRVDKMRIKLVGEEAGNSEDEKKKTGDEKAEGRDAEKVGERSEDESGEKKSEEPTNEVKGDAAEGGEKDMVKAGNAGTSEAGKMTDEDKKPANQNNGEEEKEESQGGKKVSDEDKIIRNGNVTDGKTLDGDQANKASEVAAEDNAMSDERSEKTLEEAGSRTSDEAKEELSKKDKKAPEKDNKASDEGKEKPSKADEKPPPEGILLIAEDIIGPEPTDTRFQSEACKELEKMVGLDDVKKAIGSLLNRARTNYHRELLGKEPLRSSLNRVFLGPPGTGKTTVAKLYGKIVAEIGLLSTKEVLFTSPGDFIGQYIGQSEAKTSQIMDSSLGKVLIIDEAHMFYHGSRPGTSDSSDEFRLACLDIIISQVHNTPGEDRCVILLGYPDMMEEMFQKANPGLRRRFPLEEAFRFNDYDDKRLNEILRHKMAREEIAADEPAMEVAAEVLRRARDRPNFGNGGDVDNLLSQAKARFRERVQMQKAATAAADSPDPNAVVKEIPEEEASAAKDLADEEEEVAITLEREDFDPEWDRGTRASQKCRALFDGLIGFDGVIDKFQGYQRMAANMRLKGKDPKDTIPFTFVFKGPPGTGKTHTARIIGQVFYDMGFLSTNEVIECSASHMIGQFLGQTAPKVIDLFERALGKVLFIDEAYRLGGGGVRGQRSSFEDEAVGELVDCMTKPRYMRKMIVVLAGYDRDMEALMQVNAGLRGRFATEIMFPPMDASRSRVHLFNLLEKNDIEVWDEVEPSRDDKERVLRLFDKLGMTSGWSNARDVKTLAAQITAQVYRNGPEDGDGAVVDKDAKFRISTKDLLEFLKDMLRQRIKGGGRK